MFCLRCNCMAISDSVDTELITLLAVDLENSPSSHSACGARLSELVMGVSL